MMGKVIVLCGCSGSGKSTLARKEWPEAEVCSADQYFMVGAEYVFAPALLPLAHGACLRRFTDLVSQPTAWPAGAKERTVVVVDNTNTTVAEVAPYAALAQAWGWDLEVWVLRCNPLKAHNRNRHGVPLTTVLGQADRLANLRASLPPWWPVKTVDVED